MPKPTPQPTTTICWTTTPHVAILASTTSRPIGFRLSSSKHYLVARIEFKNCIKIDANGDPIMKDFGGNSEFKSNYEMKKHYEGFSDVSCEQDREDGISWARVPGLEFNIQWEIQGNEGNKLANGGWSFSNGIDWDLVVAAASERHDRIHAGTRPAESWVRAMTKRRITSMATTWPLGKGTSMRRRLAHGSQRGLMQ